MYTDAESAREWGGAIPLDGAAGQLKTPPRFNQTISQWAGRTVRIFILPDRHTVAFFFNSVFPTLFFVLLHPTWPLFVFVYTLYSFVFVL